MWECSYAKEPMDYKLFWLRFVKKIWLVLAATLLGGTVVGVPYYLVNVTFGEEAKYKMTSEYYLDYAEDGSGATYEYFNYFTWSEIVDTDEFLTILKAQIPASVVMSDAELRESTDATIESDTRFLYTTVLTENPDTAVMLKDALEKAVIEYGKKQKEFQEVKVVTSPDEADLSYPDVRCLRAIVLGLALGLFFGLLLVCIMLLCDSSIYLPRTIERRYGIKALGCESFSETKNNIRYATKNINELSVIFAESPKESSKKANSLLKEELNTSCQVFIEEENVLAETFDFESLRKTDGTVLMIKAGAHDGKKIERILEQLHRQDIQMLGAILYGEDKKLIQKYYG